VFVWYQRKQIQARRNANLQPHSDLEAVQHNVASTPQGISFGKVECDRLHADDNEELGGGESKAVNSGGGEGERVELDGRVKNQELAARIRANAHELDGSKDPDSETVESWELIFSLLGKSPPSCNSSGR
jgi:hypothetical protein